MLGYDGPDRLSFFSGRRLVLFVGLSQDNLSSTQAQELLDFAQPRLPGHPVGRHPIDPRRVDVGARVDQHPYAVDGASAINRPVQRILAMVIGLVWIATIIE